MKPSQIAHATLKTNASTSFLLEIPSKAEGATSPQYYTGVEASTKKPVTVKTYLRTGIKEEDLKKKECMEREGQMLEMVDHEAIVKCFGYGQGVIEQEDGKIALCFYIVLERMQDPSVIAEKVYSYGVPSSRKATLCFPLSEIKRKFAKLIDAIAYLHSVGISLGRLTFDSIGLSGDSNLDFKIVDMESSTVEEILPKRFTGMDEEPIKFAEDVYKLGIILFGMMTKQLPFEDNREPKGSQWKQMFYSYRRLAYWQLMAQKCGRVIEIEFINVINGMLESDSRRRITAEQLLKCQYFQE